MYYILCNIIHYKCFSHLNYHFNSVYNIAPHFPSTAVPFASNLINTPKGHLIYWEGGRGGLPSTLVTWKNWVPDLHGIYTTNHQFIPFQVNKCQHHQSCGSFSRRNAVLFSPKPSFFQKKFSTTQIMYAFLRELIPPTPSAPFLISAL
jgi:hypothetical protein